MRRSSLALASLTATAAIGACSLINAPEEVKPGGAGGGGGSPASSSSSSSKAAASSSSTAASSSSSGGVGCSVAADCKMLDDMCSVGACINSVCQKQADPTKEGNACDDGLFCTDKDTCQKGTCTGTPRMCAAAMDPCHVAACDEASASCTLPAGNDGAACDDGDPCTAGDTCFAGACKAGAPTDCSNLNTACSVGACQKGVGCVGNPINEGLPCNINNVCATSQCVTGKCTTTSVFNGKACDDGLFCTDNDTCQNAVCAGTPKVCPGATPCQTAACDEAAKKCTLTPLADGTACDDANACTFGTTCAMGVCTPAGSVTTCINGDQCCPANCTFNNDSDCGFLFKPSQVVDGQTVTCSSVLNTPLYTECDDLKANGLYFPNGVNCGPVWSMMPSPYTDLAGFCKSLTGSAVFEVYYTCDVTQARAKWTNHVWSTTMDNGFSQHLRCYH